MGTMGRVPQGAGSDREVRRCRGSAELIDALDTVLDKNSAIYSFRREQNAAAHNLALALHAECMALWREGGGPQKRHLVLLGKAPSKSTRIKAKGNNGAAAQMAASGHDHDHSERVEQERKADLVAAELLR